MIEVKDLNGSNLILSMPTREPSHTVPSLHNWPNYSEAAYFLSGKCIWLRV